MQKKEGGFVKWFSELSNKDILIAGGKGASLAEMTNIKMPIPPGFIISAQAYAYFLHENHLDDKITEILHRTDVNNTAQLNDASKKVRSLIESASMPLQMQEEILEAYSILDVDDSSKASPSNLLSDSDSGAFVAVRSSATTEDLADASFAGQQDTFLNVRGKNDLLEKVKKCMSSLFTARAIYYREKKGFDHRNARLAVVVQKMINSVKSGVMFSRNPTSSEENLVIEAVWGLGEGIVSGQIKPDHYVISRDLENFNLEEIKVFKKNIAFVRNNDGHTEVIKLPEETGEKRVLDNYELKRLAMYALELEQHYKKAQDIEFAIDYKGIYIVQSRPITTIFKKAEKEVAGEVLLSGLGASPGISSGQVKIVHSLEELEKIMPGDVLVTEMTNPDMVVAMQRAAGIITDEGGITSHAAIVSREMGIPAVVGTVEATKKLVDGQVVTVDGNNGRIINGQGETKLIEIKPIISTKTEIKVIIDLPDFADRAALSKCRAVGLTRLEGIIAEGGKHPLKFVKDNKMKEYIALVSQGIKKIAKHFDEVWVRTSDIRSDEYQHLEGAPKETEGNPMLGDHGVRFSLKHKDIMEAEILAIKEIADDFPSKRFGVMIPQVISVDEVRKTKELALKISLPKNVILGIMVETPAAVQIIEDLCKEGISFISFGTNDLTQYTLAIDRNNEHVQPLYNEMHPAVLKSLSQVIQTCKKYNIKTSICGQAGSREDMVSFLVKEGISSISVNADAAYNVSLLVSKLESSLVQVTNTFTEPAPVVSKEETSVEINSLRKINVLPEEAIDLEDTILKALDGEYSPGDSAESKTSMPQLNDAIPIDSSMLNSQVSSIKSYNLDEDKEKESENEEDSDNLEGNDEFGNSAASLLSDSLVNEWSGEGKD